MAIDFPNSPTNGDTFSAEGKTWQYSSGKWIIISAESDMIVIEHGSNANVERPAGIKGVYWKGSVSPANGANGDLWYDTTGD